MKPNDTIFTSGKYFTGCNYWASHAGTNMWVDWRPDVVDEDMARLAAHNVRVMRMFPNWRDFQPLRIHYGGGSHEREIRLREDPLPFTDAGRAGVDIVMADRFAQFCDLAEKHGIKDNEYVDVLIDSIKPTKYFDVQVRIRDDFNVEMHIDTDDANSAGIKNGDMVKIIK